MNTYLQSVHYSSLPPNLPRLLSKRTPRRNPEAVAALWLVSACLDGGFRLIHRSGVSCRYLAPFTAKIEEIENRLGRFRTE